LQETLPEQRGKTCAQGVWTTIVVVAPGEPLTDEAQVPEGPFVELAFEKAKVAVIEGVSVPRDADVEAPLSVACRSRSLRRAPGCCGHPTRWTGAREGEVEDAWLEEAWSTAATQGNGRPASSPSRAAAGAARVPARGSPRDSRGTGPHARCSARPPGGWGVVASRKFPGSPKAGAVTHPMIATAGFGPPSAGTGRLDSRVEKEVPSLRSTAASGSRYGSRAARRHRSCSPSPVSPEWEMNARLQRR